MAPRHLLAELDNIDVTVEDMPPADALEDDQEVVLLCLYQGGDAHTDRRWDGGMLWP